MTDLLAARDRFPESVFVGTRVPAELIDQAAHRIGLEFPPTYRAFLERFGSAAIGAWEVAGLHAGVTDLAKQEVVDRSLAFAHASGQRNVVICDDGGEYYFALDAAGRIVVVDKFSGEDDEGWPSGLTFDEFIADLCRQVQDEHER